MLDTILQILHEAFEELSTPGRSLQTQGTRGAVQRSLESFEAAIRLDPNQWAEVVGVVPTAKQLAPRHFYPKWRSFAAHCWRREVI